MPDTPYVLGWHRPKASRVQAFTTRRYPVPQASELRSVTHERHGEVLNQGRIGSCSGNDVIDCLMCEPLWDGDAYDEQNAVEVYSLATELDRIPGHYPPQDTGSTNVAAAAAAVRLGLAYGWTHCQTFNDFCHALVLQPVMFASDWTRDMFTPDPSGQVHPTGPVEGGHSYAAVGFDVEQERVWFQNSWGYSWGVGGKFWLSWTDAAILSEGSEMIALHVKPAAHRQRAPRGCMGLVA